MVILKRFTVVLLLIFSVNICFGSEISDGFLRLILDEKTGGFSLYYLTNPRTRTYVPLFYADDTSTSFISVMVDDVVFKPSESRFFVRKIETPHGQPSLVFESSFVLIRQIFSPVKTPGSNNINGVQITTTIQNKKPNLSFIGFRYLLDTSLGEDRGRVPFITKNQIIRRETTIEGNSDELFWISRGRDTSLMGSIVNPIDYNARRPDYIHFANWKRLYDADWNLEVREGRSFNHLPYSVGDSAVCYYYLPRAVESGETLSFSIVLTTMDVDWYNNIPESAFLPAAVPVPLPQVSAAVPAAAQNFFETEPAFEPELYYEPESYYEQDSYYEQESVYMHEFHETDAPDDYPHLNTAELRELYALQETLVNFIEGRINLSEDDLTEIERTIDRLKAGK